MTAARSFVAAFAEACQPFTAAEELRTQRDQARDIAVVLENRIERALAEHQPVGGFTLDEQYCGTCVDAPGENALRWPCPSVAALTGGGDDEAD